MSVHKSVLTQAVANNGFPFEIKRNPTSPFVTMSEDELLEKLSAAREHSAQGKQSQAGNHLDYEIYAKPAERVVNEFYRKKER